jgi:hypothetical protein
METDRRWRVTGSGITPASWDAVAQQGEALSDWAQRHPGVELSYERHAVRDVFISLNVTARDAEQAITLGEALIQEIAVLLPAEIDSFGALPLKTEPVFTYGAPTAPPGRFGRTVVDNALTEISR